MTTKNQWAKYFHVCDCQNLSTFTARKNIRVEISTVQINLMKALNTFVLSKSFQSEKLMTRNNSKYIHKKGRSKHLLQERKFSNFPILLCAELINIGYDLKTHKSCDNQTLFKHIWDEGVLQCFFSCLRLRCLQAFQIYKVNSLFPTITFESIR